METQKDISFLKEEYFHLQGAVEDSDARALSIKQWSVTTSMAGIVAGMIEGEPLVFLLAAAASCVFWVIEALWKSFQYANYYRLRRIEDFLNGVEVKDFRYPYITHSWTHAWRKASIFKIMRWPHVFLPHLLVMIIGGGMWVYFRFGPAFE